MKKQSDKVHVPKAATGARKKPAEPGLSHFLSLFIIVFLGVIIYSNSFDCTFHFDDEPNILENKLIRNFSGVSALWSDNPSRFLPLLSLVINYQLGEFDVWGYHLVNLMIHLINSCLVYFLILSLFSTPSLKGDALAGRKRIIAFAAALFFVSHPLATQSVTYIVQRMASMAAMFYLFSLALYVRGRLMESSIASKYLLYAGSLVMALAALSSKENAYTLPFAALLIEFCFFRPKTLSINFRDYRIYLAAAVFAGFVVFTLSRYSAFIFRTLPPSFGSTETITPVNYLNTQFTVIPKYIQLLVLPINQNLDYDWPLSPGFFEWKTLLSFIFLSALLIFAIIQFNKNRVISFCIIWFFLTLSIESSILPLEDVIFEHRTYLPSVGFFFLLAYMIQTVFHRKPAFIYMSLPLIIAGIFSFLTYDRNEVWKNEFTLMGDVLKKSPQKARPRINLGMAYSNAGDWETAKGYFIDALAINPKFFDAANNLGAAYLNLSKWDSANIAYAAALRLDTTLAKAYYGHAYALMRLKKSDSAILDFSKAIKLKRAYTLAYSGRAQAYFDIGQFENAIADFDSSLQLDSNNSVDYFKRGCTYGNLGKYDKALVDFSKAIELDPKFSDALLFRANTFTNMGQYEKAIQDYDRVLQLKPGDRVVLENRDRAMRQLGQAGKTRQQ